MSKFCPESCLFKPDCIVDCHHKHDVEYDKPIKARINYGKPIEVEIVGENRNVIANYYGSEIGPTWYVRDKKGRLSGIMYQNPLVELL